jgi:GT2 family glycosyltransferase
LESADPPEYVLLLNPDTVVRPEALKHLLEFLDTHPTAGIAGSRLEDPDGTPQRSAFRFHTVLSELEHGLRLGFVSRLLSRHIVAPPVPTGNAQADWVAGASMMIRKSVFDKIGLMDEAYFMYFEEVDFCLRARRAGFTCWYVPASRVVHLVGQASGVTDSQRSARRRPRYWFASRRRYFRKNLGFVKTLLADLCWAGGFALFRIRQAIQRKPGNDPKFLLWDFVRYNLFPTRK